MGKRWLLVSGITILSLTIFYLIYFKVSPPLSAKGPASFSSFYVVTFIIPVIVAPILEEIRFRGFLTKNKIIQGLFLLLTPLGLLVYGWNLLLFVFTLIIYLLFALHKALKKGWVLDLLIFVSAVYFSFGHLPIGVDFSWSWLPWLATSFSFALILSWVIINRSIGWAVIVHGSWNLILGLIFLAALQFVSEDLNTVENEKYKVEWKRVPFFDSETATYKPEGKRILIRGMNLQDVLGIVEPSALDSFVVLEPFMKYDIKLETKGGNDAFKNDLVEALELDSLLLRR